MKISDSFFGRIEASPEAENFFHHHHHFGPHDFLLEFCPFHWTRDCQNSFSFSKKLAISFCPKLTLFYATRLPVQTWATQISHAFPRAVVGLSRDTLLCSENNQLSMQICTKYGRQRQFPTKVGVNFLVFSGWSACCLMAFSVMFFFFESVSMVSPIDTQQYP